jgi:hypothetical protein
MTNASIGFTRDDGDFAVLATLNNNDGHLSDELFGQLVRELTQTLALYTEQPMTALNRQDTPDYIQLDTNI